MESLNGYGNTYTEAHGPNNQQRVIVLGRTGTGKSVFAIALLSTRNWIDDAISQEAAQPWVIIDYKGEDLIDEIREKCGKRIKTISVHDKPPTKPGLYWMKPTPKIDDEAMEKWLWAVWKNGKTGLFIDEGFALPQKDAFDAILTQGRSLRIPVIVLYQRPAWMSRFAVAQADFVAVFDQNDERDLKTTKSFVKSAILTNKEGNKLEVTVYSELPKYHCLWYDVGRGYSSVLFPAPDPKQILSTFKRRLRVVSPANKARALI
jgi:hypothetical protein